jgi:hypothetical protein
MDRREVERALDIFPAPPAPPNLAWRGRALSIEPDTAWAANQTYIVTLQVEARDLRGNRLARSRQVAFSTGEKIDSGRVSGTILRSLRSQAGALALCYRVDGTPLNPETDTADYVVVSDAEGRFEFEFLSPGSYRVFGLEDRDRDWLWNIGSEWIAVPGRDVELNELQPEWELQPLHLTALDTVRALPTACRRLSDRFVRVDFDRATDALTLSRCEVATHGQGGSTRATRVYVRDTLAASLWAEFANLPADARELTVRLPGPRPQTDTCALEAAPDAVARPLELERIDPDTVVATITSLDLVRLLFDSPVATLSREDVLLGTGTDTLSGRVRMADPFSLWLEPREGPFPPGRIWFRIAPDLVRASRGQMWPADTTVEFVVTAPLADSSGDFEIHYDPPDSVAGAFSLGCYSLTRPGTGLWRRLDGALPVRGVLMPGDYQLQLLADSDGDGRRDPGWPDPFRPSEALWLLSDTLQIRARFTTELHLPLPTRK